MAGSTRCICTSHVSEFPSSHVILCPVVIIWKPVKNVVGGLNQKEEKSLQWLLNTLNLTLSQDYGVNNIIIVYQVSAADVLGNH